MAVSSYISATMDVRLTLPILLLLAAVILAAGVDATLQAEAAGFSVGPGGPIAGGWTAVTMIGPYGGSPELSWRGAPEGTRSFAVVGEDLDLPREKRVFWKLWNVPGEWSGLPPGVAEARGRTDDGAVAELSGTGYSAPGFRAAARHRLRVTVYALDVSAVDPGLAASAAASEFDGHVLARASWLVGGGW